ncbi:hypothetical protein K461DRAFT_48365 [Myriangium duriaei CBS 260.36]|uniref:Uncharacterized protein n=1 Tax=Myriangium duriaei CBS 260.36 TaxID=1168546 RepID=A0A9P4MJ88_9PEZI|nr:hypothetical protein K461DRAFT_48365 [Myriangium duriaei CBS 260.36]
MFKNVVTETPSRTQSPGQSRAGTPSVSRPVSPGSVADIPAKKRAHTIRLVSTPKPEAAPVITFPTAVSKLPSRNPSIASAHPPGTPTSEHISDTVSLTSATVSRPASPPPAGGGIVGSAAVRNKTKSQMKKERQERAKAIEEEKKQEQEPASEEPAQEAITSRKKKSKKPSAAPKPKPKVESVVPSPSIGTPQEDTEKPLAETAAPAPAPASKEATPEPPSAPQPSEPPTPADISPATLISQLCSDSKLFSSCLETFLRPLTQTQAAYKPTTPITPADIPLDRPFKRFPDLNLGPEQLAPMLTSGEPLKYGSDSAGVWSHGCITPAGAHLRHLEQELEERFLALERSERGRPREGKFNYFPSFLTQGEAGRLEGEWELPRIDIDAVRSGGGERQRENNAMEKAVEEGSKKGSFLVGSAESYIDSFVLPVQGWRRKGRGWSGGGSRRIGRLWGGRIKALLEEEELYLLVLLAAAALRQSSLEVRALLHNVHHVLFNF